MKKFLSLALVLVMILSLSAVVFADESAAPEPVKHTLTITGTTPAHTFAVYQLFVADIVRDANGGYKLSNIKYGANYGTEGEDIDATELEKLQGKDFDIDKWAAELTLVGNPIATKSGSSSGSIHFGELPAGYYMIREISESVPANQSYSKHMVQIVGETTITPKSGTTSSQKKVKDNDLDENPWQDSADYSVGDTVPFQLTAVVASDYANYTKGYKLTFHDKMDAGLTFQPSSVKVYVNGHELTNENNYYQVLTVTEDDCTFAVHFPNLKNVSNVGAGSVITVEYNAVLNQNAVIGEDGNWNQSKITYTNNPNVLEDGEPDENGNTPLDKVVVFTYKLVATKYANSISDETKLSGAEFTLTKAGHSTPIAVVTGDEGKVFTFNHLDAGSYVLTETKTPEGYNTIKPIEFTIVATHDTNADTPKLTDLKVTGHTMSTNLDGTVSVDVINKAGSSLPTTGGIGTHIFYLVGTVLALGAGVMLITKKRMNNI